MLEFARNRKEFLRFLDSLRSISENKFQWTFELISHSLRLLNFPEKKTLQDNRALIACSEGIKRTELQLARRMRWENGEIKARPTRTASSPGTCNFELKRRLEKPVSRVNTVSIFLCRWYRSIFDLKTAIMLQTSTPKSERNSANGEGIFCLRFWHDSWKRNIFQAASFFNKRKNPLRGFLVKFKYFQTTRISAASLLWLINRQQV